MDRGEMGRFDLFDQLQPSINLLTSFNLLPGPVGSRVQGFGCVFYQKEFMECTWETSLEEPTPSQYSLYYW